MDFLKKRSTWNAPLLCTSCITILAASTKRCASPQRWKRGLAITFGHLRKSPNSPTRRKFPRKGGMIMRVLLLVALLLVGVSGVHSQENPNREEAKKESPKKTTGSQNNPTPTITLRVDNNACPGQTPCGKRCYLL